MHDSRSHPLLAQVPLTVSPFVQLPRAATLPYRYKTMPSALPPSLLDADPSVHASASATADTPAKPAYVVAATTAAHPDDIRASCRTLHQHLARLQADADATLQALTARIAARDLAERRRVAPGWLDSDDHLLVPEKPLPEQEPPHETQTESAALESTATATTTTTTGSTAEELHRTLGGLVL